MERKKLAIRRRKPERTRISTTLDLAKLVFDADRDVRQVLRADPELSDIAAQRAGAGGASGPKRELLKTAIRLTPRMAPAIFGNVEACAKQLGITTPIDVFCFQDPQMNAFVVPPESGSVTIGVSSGLVERLDDAEMRFVVGHELGHALFDHHELGPELLEGEAEVRLAPVVAMRLFAWMRYAELSADRVGLLCCGDFDTAVRAFFKLTSGLSSPAHVAGAGECVTQYTALQAEDAERDPGDWYSTHPYNPLRVKALDLFARSSTFVELGGKGSGELGEAELEREVAKLVATMEPLHLHTELPAGAQARELLALAGYLIAGIDGEVDDSEAEALAAIVGEGPQAEAALALLESLSPDDADRRIGELAETLSTQLSLLHRQKLVEDLCVIALADKRVTDEEVEALATIADCLHVDPMFVDQVLSAPAHALDLPPPTHRDEGIPSWPRQIESRSFATRRRARPPVSRRADRRWRRRWRRRRTARSRRSIRQPRPS